MWADGDAPLVADADVPTPGPSAGFGVVDLLAQVPDDKAALVEFAADHSIEVDNRLTAVNMRAAIADALAASGDTDSE